VIEIFPTPEKLADAVARHIVQRARQAILANGRFTFALSGGSTPRAAYARLARNDLARRINWKNVHILWGDERCVPPDDPRSNYRMAKEAMLDRVPIPPQQIHRIRGEDFPEDAAEEYERELRELQRRGSLTLVLLGLGEDGHTASLFPGQAVMHERERWVLATPVPDGTMWRVTMTPAVINAARSVTFVVSGESKAARLQEVLQGPFTPDVLPAQAIQPIKGQLLWMVDEAAAARLRTVQAAPHPDPEHSEGEGSTP
jgi:6-phosphogluconolactonase